MPYTLYMALLVHHSYEFYTGGAGKLLLRAHRGSLVRHWLGEMSARCRIEAPAFLSKHRIGPDGIPVGAGNTAQAGENAQLCSCAVFFIAFPSPGSKLPLGRQ